MRLVFSSVLLGLAWFGAINAAVSLVAWTIGRWALVRGPERKDKTELLLSLRFLPSLASSVFVAAVFLPSHWRFEERQVDESFGYVLALLALVGAAIVIRSAHRLARTAWRGHRLLRAVRGGATRIDGGAFAVPGLPGISLAGIVCTEILVGSDALNALTPAELAMAISHEKAHRRSRDNIKRFLMFCSPDLFRMTAVARQIEAAWEAETECRADAAAVDGDEARAVLLASALVKVAKLKSRGPFDAAQDGPSFEPMQAWSAFHVPTLLETRVRRLVAGRAPEQAPRRRVWVPITIAAFATPTVVWLADLSYTLHVVTETMVTRLP